MKIGPFSPGGVAPSNALACPGVPWSGRNQACSDQQPPGNRWTNSPGEQAPTASASKQLQQPYKLIDTDMHQPAAFCFVMKHWLDGWAVGSLFFSCQSEGVGNTNRRDSYPRAV